jgi:hypothetical protein
MVLEDEDSGEHYHLVTRVNRYDEGDAQVVICLDAGVYVLLYFQYRTGGGVKWEMAEIVCEYADGVIKLYDPMAITRGDSNLRARIMGETEKLWKRESVVILDAMGEHA